MANSESCATCHGSIVATGEDHQAIYNQYQGSGHASSLYAEFGALTVTPNGALYDVSVDLTIEENGAPLASLDDIALKRAYFFRYDPVENGYFDVQGLTLAGAAGAFTATATGVGYDPSTNAAFFIYIGDEDVSPADVIDGKHMGLYANIGAAGFTTAGAEAYSSPANVEGCENCHGSPYLKHGNRPAQVAGLPDFVACRACHYDDRSGGHEDWQWMADDPYAWATEVMTPEIEAQYAYTANVRNDVHMSHAMEFPYPQSMANCATCHEGNLGAALDNDNFTLEFCTSCHAVNGEGTWPESFVDYVGDGVRQPYYQSGKPPALQYLWTRAGQEVDDLHDPVNFPNCQGCHGNGAAPAFDMLHTGYDPRITREDGVRYEDIWYVTIDDITLAENHLTVEVSASDAAITPEVYVSFYGWNSKQFYLSSHERTVTPMCGSRGCRMEAEFGEDNALFSYSGANPGPYTFNLEMATGVWEYPGSLLDMIADGRVKYAEVTAITGITGTAGVTQTFDLTTGQMVEGYFKDNDDLEIYNAIVDIDKCDKCHDQLAVTFHGGGRGGDIVICKNCHYPANDGSHYEMQSRSIDSYVHAVHSFQLPDPGSVDWDDPVEAAWAEMHTHHTFPNFTITNCEGCHKAGMYNVPDQAESMPSWQSATDTVPADVRSVGDFPSAITGPASRSCAGCHRAHYLKFDWPGAIVNVNAHTKANGTYIEDPEDDTDFEGVVWDVIDKLMSYFQ